MLPADSRSPYLRPPREAGAPHAGNLDRLEELGGAFFGRVDDLLFLPDGRLVAAGGFGLWLIDPETLTHVARPLRGRVYSAALAGPDTLAAIVAHKGDWGLFKLGLHGELTRLADVARWSRVAASQDGTAFVPGPQSSVRVIGLDGTERATLNPTSPQNNAFSTIVASDDGRWVLGDRHGSYCTVWEVATGKVVMEGSAFSPRSGCFLPGDRVVFTGRTFEKGLHVHALSSAGLGPRAPLGMPEYELRQVRSIPTGELLVVGSSDRGSYKGLVVSEHFFDTAPFFSSEGAGAVTWAASAKHVAHYDEHACALRVTRRNATDVGTLSGFPPRINALGVGGRPAVVAVQLGSSAGTYRLRFAEPERVETLQEPSGSTERVVAVDPSGERVLIGTDEAKNTIKVSLLDKAGATLNAVGARSYLWAVGFVPGSDRFWTMSHYSNDGATQGDVTVFAPNRNKALRRVQVPMPRRAAWSGDGQRFASCGTVFGPVIAHRRKASFVAGLWDATTGNQLWSEPLEAEGTAIAVDATGERVAVVYGHPDRKLWLKTPAGVSVQTAPVMVCSMAFVGSEPLLWLGDDGGGLHVYDYERHTLAKSVEAHTEALTELELAGGLLWTASGDGTVRAWGVPGEAPAPIEAPTQAVAEEPAAEEPAAESAAAGPGWNPADWPLAAVSLPTEPLTYGTQAVSVVWTEAGAPGLVRDGKPLRSFPRASAKDEPAARDAAQARWEALKEGFESARKAQVRLLKRAFIEGRPWRYDALQRAVGSPAVAAVLQGLVWTSGGRVLRLAGAEALGSTGPVACEGDALLVLAHPAELNAPALAEARALLAASGQKPAVDQLDRRVMVRPGRGTALSPIQTDWAKTPNTLVDSILRGDGWTFEEFLGTRGDSVYHRRFAHLDCVAICTLDEEHGCSGLHFARTPEDAAAERWLELTEVHPRALSEGALSVFNAWPYDQKGSY